MFGIDRRLLQNFDWALVAFVAILLLSILASRPHAHAHKGTSEKKTTRKAPDGGPWKAIASEVRTAIETERDGTKAPRV